VSFVVLKLCLSVSDAQFEKLKLFRELNGHTNVPKDYNIDPQFGRWIQTQRTMFRRNAMTAERKQALESIGFEFRVRDVPTLTEQDEIWNMQLEKLKIFKQANGHCNVPHSYTVDTGLGRWVATQRTTYRRKQMPEVRVQQLECLGFEWRLGPPVRTWGENFALLSNFHDTNGHAHYMSKGSGDKTLQNWIVNQRQKFAKGLLSQEQIQQLQSIGFAWTTEQEKSLVWDFQYGKLKQFYGEHGHLGTPEKFPEDPDLLEWISSQHQVYFAKKMPEENVEKLVAIGFIFNNDGHNASTVAVDEDTKPAAGSRISWNQHFLALKSFKVSR
jgi:Helicase associated domain